MRPRVLVVLSLIVSACSGTLHLLAKGSTTTAPDDAYTCAVTKLGSMGYSRSRYNAMDRWYEAKKVDPTARVSDGLFQHRLNRIDVQVQPQADGTTELALRGRTVDVYTSARGDNEVERSASREVRTDMEAILQACGGGTAAGN